MRKRARVTTSTLTASPRGWFRYTYARAGRRYIVDAGGPRARYYEAQSAL